MKTLIALISSISILLLAFSPLIILSCSSDIDKFQNNGPRDEGIFPGDIPGIDIYDIITTSDPLLEQSFGNLDDHQFSQYAYGFLPEFYEDLGMQRKYVLNVFLRAYFLMDPARSYVGDGGWWFWDTAEDEGRLYGIDKNIIPDIMTEVHDILNRINNQDGLSIGPNYYPSYPEYPGDSSEDATNFAENFYNFMDKLSEVDAGGAGNLIKIMKKSMYYANDTYGLKDINDEGYDSYNAGWHGFDNSDGIPGLDTLGTIDGLDGLAQTMKDFMIEEIIDGSSNPDEITIKSTAEFLGPFVNNMTIKSNDSIHADDNGNIITDPNDFTGETDAGLGNAARGIDALLSGIYEFMENESKNLDNDGAGDSEGGNLLDAATPDGQTFADALKNFVCMLEDHQTINGDAFSAGGYQNLDPSGKYYNAELRNLILESFPILQSFVINGNKKGSVIEDQMDAFDDGDIDVYPLALLCEMFNNDHSKGEKGLNIDIDTFDLAKSFYTMLRYDAAMRDRVGRSAELDNLWEPGAKYAEK